AAIWPSGRAGSSRVGRAIEGVDSSSARAAIRSASRSSGSSWRPTARVAGAPLDGRTRAGGRRTSPLILLVGWRGASMRVLDVEEHAPGPVPTSKAPDAFSGRRPCFLGAAIRAIGLSRGAESLLLRFPREPLPDLPLAPRQRPALPQRPPRLLGPFPLRRRD